MFGPPGAGKGTQAQNISKKFNLHQVSTGDLLRNEIKNKTKIGKEIEKNIAKGNFASDDTVNELLKKLIKDKSYQNRMIFDGYPRNLNQAESLEKILNAANQSINYIFFLNVDKEIIEKRILGRVVCDKCNVTLNEFFNKNEIEKHSCGSKYLTKRKDDNLKVIINRYETYIKKTKPVLDFYKSKKEFHEIDASLKIQAITDKIEAIIEV